MFGYMDPGTGSMLTQVVVAGAAGVAVAAKIGWRKATARIRGKKDHVMAQSRGEGTGPSA